MTSAIKLVERLLHGEEPVTGKKLIGIHACLPSANKSTAGRVIDLLLAEQPEGMTPVFEASVHRPARGRVWVASYSGPSGGQVWRTTGLTNHKQALVLAKNWEAEARAQRAKPGGTAKRTIWRVRRSAGGAGSGPLSQAEVALFLKMTERGVREVERRAIQKLRNHSAMKQIWRQFLAGELDEQQLALTSDEVEALFNLARTQEERRLMRKILALIHD